MTTLAELAARHTDLGPDELDHLQRLLGSWSVLADLSFSDLILIVPVSVDHPEHSHDEPQFVVIGQMRPNNRPTLIEQDLVGQTVNESAWKLSAVAFHRGEIIRGKVHHPVIGESVPVENVPVRLGDKVIAVLLRVSAPAPRGPLSPYEKTYLDVFERLAEMVADSAFPFPDEDIGTEETPRVGDGCVLVDAEGKVEFASPNAINAFHRMGVYAPPEGRRFTEAGIEESAVEWALATGRPVVEEVERRPDVVVLVHCIPLVHHERIAATGGTGGGGGGHGASARGDGGVRGPGKVTGAVILLRDVTDVRRLGRLLLSKDAAIREVHHRVKNNLQTISSLLNLQARRVGVGEGREALREAERRVRSISLVHEILSREPGEQVPFGDIVESLVQMAEDSVVSSNPVEITVTGDLGDVSADIATPLAVIVAEVLQNAIEHAFAPAPEEAGPDDADRGGPTPAPTSTGHVVLRLANRGTELGVVVEDDGCGLPQGFSIERTTSLGLSIVRDLVLTQLGGTIAMQRVPDADGGGTRVVIRVPIERG